MTQLLRRKCCFKFEFQRACECVFQSFQKMTEYDFKDLQTTFPAMAQFLTILYKEKKMTPEVLQDYFTLPSGKQDLDTVTTFQNQLKVMLEDTVNFRKRHLVFCCSPIKN